MTIIKSVLVLFALFLVEVSMGQTAVNTVASCCSAKKGRCTGSASCTACTNCSRCAHCNSGGSCGVCAGRTTPKTYNYKNQSSKSTTREYYSSGTYNLPDNYSSQYYKKTLVVNSQTLNLRKGPSTSYAIIQELKRDQELIFLAMIGDWVKVQVKTNGRIGFVYYKYVLVIE